MNRAPHKKLLESDPKLLASLIAADDDDIGQRIWSQDELATILRHQMTTPLHVDLAGLDGAAGRLKAEAAAGGLLLKSFGDLLQHPHPPLKLLNMMKDFAKACRISPVSALPREISSIIYFASILAAMTKRSRRITSLGDKALRDAIRWALSQSWLDEISRAVFLDGQAFLAGTSPNPVYLVSEGTVLEEGGGQHARATGGPGMLPGASQPKTSAKQTVLGTAPAAADTHPTPTQPEE